MNDIAPILTGRCEACHGANKAEGKYRLDTFDNLLRAGSSGESPIAAGRPQDSEIYRLITDDDRTTRMPRKDDPLSDEQVELIHRWIAQGAPFDGPDTAMRLRRMLPPRTHPPAPAVYRRPVPVVAAAFSPDGTELALGGYHEATVWSVSDGSLVRRIGGLPQRVHGLAYSADGRSLLVGGGTPGDYGELAIVALAPADQARVLGTFEDVVLGVSTSRDGGRVAGCSADGSLRVYDTESGQMLWEQVAHSDWATAVSFDHEGTRIASASKDKTVKVFDAATGELFVTYMGHRKQFGKHAGQFEVFDVVFDEASRAYSAGEGPAVRLWDPAVAREENGTAADMEQRFAREGHTQYIVHGHKHPLLRLAVTVESVYCASGDGVVTRHDRATLERTGVFEGLEEWVTALAVHAPGQRLAAGTLSGQVRIWDVQTGELLTEFTAAPGYGVKDAAARR